MLKDEQLIYVLFQHEDIIASSALGLLETARKDIIAELGKDPSQWTYYKLPELLTVVNARIDTLSVGLNNISVDMEKLALADGKALGTLAKPEIAPVSDIYVSPNLLKALGEYRADLIKGVTNEMRDKVTEIIRRSLLTGRSQYQVMLDIGRAINTNIVYHTERIFRTEYLRIANVANQSGLEDTAKYFPNLKKKWVATFINTRPAHVEVHGQVVPYNEPFIVGGEQLMFPLDPMGSPQNVINCRCLSVAVF